MGTNDFENKENKELETLYNTYLKSGNKNFEKTLEDAKKEFTAFIDHKRDFTHIKTFNSSKDFFEKVSPASPEKNTTIYLTREKIESSYVGYYIEFDNPKYFLNRHIQESTFQSINEDKNKSPEMIKQISKEFPPPNFIDFLKYLNRKNKTSSNITRLVYMLQVLSSYNEDMMLTKIMGNSTTEQRQYVKNAAHNILTSFNNEIEIFKKMDPACQEEAAEKLLKAINKKITDIAPPEDYDSVTTGLEDRVPHEQMMAPLLSLFPSQKIIDQKKSVTTGSEKLIQDFETQLNKYFLHLLENQDNKKEVKRLSGKIFACNGFLKIAKLPASVSIEERIELFNKFKIEVFETYPEVLKIKTYMGGSFERPDTLQKLIKDLDTKLSSERKLSSEKNKLNPTPNPQLSTNPARFFSGNIQEQPKDKNNLNGPSKKGK